MGISGGPISEQLSKTLDIKCGVVVTHVLPNSPVKQVGFQPFSAATNQGDVIVAIDDMPIHSVDDMVGYFNKKRPGNDITINVVRNGNNLKVKVDQGKWPAI